MYSALRKWKNDIKMNLEKLGCECLDLVRVRKDSVVVAIFRKRSYRTPDLIKEVMC